MLHLCDRPGRPGAEKLENRLFDHCILSDSLVCIGLQCCLSDLSLDGIVTPRDGFRCHA